MLKDTNTPTPTHSLPPHPTCYTISPHSHPPSPNLPPLYLLCNPPFLHPPPPTLQAAINHGYFCITLKMWLPWQRVHEVGSGDEETILRWSIVKEHIDAISGPLDAPSAQPGNSQVTAAYHGSTRLSPSLHHNHSTCLTGRTHKQH